MWVLVNPCTVRVAYCAVWSQLQVEKVICYDAFQSPIRNIQRLGRTGRHEAGHVVHIITEGHEERKYQASLEVHPSIISWDCSSQHQLIATIASCLS